MSTRPLSHISTVDIFRELKRRHAALLSEVAQIESTFSENRGTAARHRRAKNRQKVSNSKRAARKTRDKRSPREGNKTTLAEAMAKVLGDGKKPVAEIVAGIAATGYKSKSKNLSTMAAIQLGQRKDLFRRVKRGVYKVKR